MLRSRVTSSTFNSVGYDEEHHILEVEFQTREVYQYFEVPVEVYEAFMNADSLGAYFSEDIRPVYDFKHIL
jgi:hypothetical protein